MAFKGISGKADRQVARYQLSAPVVFFWKLEKQTRMRAEGTLRDIGPRGIFVFGKNVPPLNVETHVEILLPPIREDSKPVRIKGVGRVIRRHLGPENVGFALLSTSLLLRPATARTSQPLHAEANELPGAAPNFHPRRHRASAVSGSALFRRSVGKEG
jgi:hypothetical protein